MDQAKQVSENLPHRGIDVFRIAGQRAWGFGVGRANAPISGFFIADYTTGARRFAIDTAGNVGIGTMAPSGQLHLSNGPILIATTKIADSSGCYYA